MESDIDVMKDFSDIYWDHYPDLDRVTLRRLSVRDLTAVWNCMVKPVIERALKFTTQDLKDGLDASLIPLSEDLQLAMLLEWRAELDTRINEIQAKKSNQEEV